jgi:hypothetical protein
MPDSQAAIEAMENKRADGSLLNMNDVWRRLLAWQTLLTMNYVLTLFLALEFTIPHDREHFVSLQRWKDVKSLWSFGAVTFFLASLNEDPRMSRRLFLVFHFLFPALFSLISSTSPFTSIDTVGALTHNRTGIIVYSVVLVVISMIIAWHCWYASQVFAQRQAFWSYIGLRAAITLGCAAEIGLMMLDQGPGSAYVHHYYVAFVVSLWCSFDHVISELTLAASSGLLVQGIGAYSAADILIGEETMCWGLGGAFDMPFTTFLCNNTALLASPTQPTPAIWRVCMLKRNVQGLQPCHGQYFMPNAR